MARPTINRLFCKSPRNLKLCTREIKVALSVHRALNFGGCQSRIWRQRADSGRENRCATCQGDPQSGFQNVLSFFQEECDAGEIKIGTPSRQSRFSPLCYFFSRKHTDTLTAPQRLESTALVIQVPSYFSIHPFRVRRRLPRRPSDYQRLQLN